MKPIRTVLAFLFLTAMICPLFGQSAREPGASRAVTLDYQIERQLNDLRSRVRDLQAIAPPVERAEALNELMLELDRAEQWWRILSRGRTIRTQAQIHLFLTVRRSELVAAEKSLGFDPKPQPLGASDGTISGTVTGSDLAPPGALQGVWVDFFDTNGEWVANTITDVNGDYTSPGLFPATYFARTWNDQLYVDELYDNILCHNICDITDEGTSIAVGDSEAITAIDFELDPGGVFSGTITDADGGAALQHVIVDVFDSTGEWVSNTESLNDGTYRTLGLPAGFYYATTYNEDHYQDELYDDIDCPFGCDPVTTPGDTIEVEVGTNTGGIDFDLEQGSFISGNVSDTVASPIPDAYVDIFNSGGTHVDFGMTDNQGDYATRTGLPSGTYYAVTSAPTPYLNEIYDGTYCPSWCDPTTGTPISVEVPLETTGIDFMLSSGGMISGTVRDAGTSNGIANVWVEFFDSTSKHVGSALTQQDGTYLSQAFPADTNPYYAKTWNDLGYIDELFQEVSCPFGCDITFDGTPIPVIANTTVLLIDFTLDAGATVSGHVSDGSSDLQEIHVEFFDHPDGNHVSSAVTNESGDYITNAFPPGTYYARTYNDLGYLNEIYDDIACPNWCDPTEGTAIVAALGDTITDIDFELALGGRVSGTVTHDPSGDPIQGAIVDIFDTNGDHVSWGGTDSSGEYISFYAVVPGTHYVKTWNDLGYTNELYDDLPCIGCDVTTGTPVEVAAGATNSDIDFALRLGGLIAGTVTEMGTSLPIEGVHVDIFDSEGDFQTFGATDADGNYTIYDSLPAGSYFARAWGDPPHIGELYENVPCNFSCDVTEGSPIAVSAGTTTQIDFELEVGGFISGSVTEFGGSAIQDIHVNIHNTAGVLLIWEPTDSAGDYTTSLVLPPGEYFVNTWNDLGYINEVYDDTTCLGCDVTLGKKVFVTSGATTTGVDFDLVMGGLISGTLTEQGTGTGIPRVRVHIHSADGTRIQGFLPDENGDYVSPIGMPSGDYFVVTSTMWGAGPRYVNEIYDDLPCPGPCDVKTGAPVTVEAGNTTSGIDFELALGGQISGTVFEAGTNNPIDFSEVLLFDSSGNFMDRTRVNGAGEFTSFRAMPPGIYYAATQNYDGYVDELYSEMNCPGGGEFCTVTAGTTISIFAGFVTENIDFTLARSGGWFSGSVTDSAWGHGLGGVNIDVYNEAGTRVTRVVWDRPLPQDGSVKTCALAPGSYYAKVDASPLLQSYADELFEGTPCVLGCDVTSGTPIPIINGIGTQNIDFDLVWLLFADGFESMDMSGWTQVVP